MYYIHKGAGGVSVLALTYLAGFALVKGESPRGYSLPILAAVAVAAALVWWFTRDAAASLPADPAALPTRVRHRLIEAEKYAPMLHKHKFRRCEIRGAVQFPGSNLKRSKLLSCTYFVVQDPSRELPPGTLSFVDCDFKRCRFNGCVIVGTKQQIESLQKTFGNQ